MGQLFGEVRVAMRSLARAPGFTVVAVLTLAVGIGANTSIFSVVNGVLIQPLPFDQPDELVNVSHTAPGLGYDQIPLSPDTYLLIREESDVFQDIGLIDMEVVNLTGEGEPQRVEAMIATRELADVFRIPFHLGRGFTAEEDRPEGPQVAILSHDLWRTRFGSDPSIVGRSILVDGAPREVVGVLPETFDLMGADTKIWLPMQMDPANPHIGNFGMQSVARLKPGQTPESAQAVLAPLIDRLMEDMAEAETYVAFIRNGRLGFLVDPLKEQMVGDLERPLWILLGTVGFVLLIACANVANLVMVRAESRQKEIAVRSALGASRGRIFGHFLSESAVLAVVGGVGGVLLAWVGTPALLSLTPSQLPRLGEIGMGLPVLGFTATLVVLATLIFGSAPALKAFSGRFGAALRSTRGSTAGRDRHRVRNVLVAGQTALALVLLVGSGLMLKSFNELHNLDPGFDAEGLLVFEVSLDRESYPSARGAADFQQELLDRLNGLPGVVSASAVDYLPLAGGGSGTSTRAEGREYGPDELPPIIYFKYIAPDYFETMGTQLLAGRGLTRADHEQALPNAVINRGAADLLWPGEDPMGRRFGGNEADSTRTLFTVVGVVEQVADESLMAEEPRPLVYYPMVTPFGDEGFAPRSMAFALRTQGPPLALAGPARAEVWGMDSDLPVQDMREMSVVVGESMARMSFTMIALAVAAVVALLLGGVGLYGVLSYVVNQRTREMGVRIALGADAGQVRWMVVRQGMAVAGVGLAVGVAASLYLTRVLESLLYGTAPNDPGTFAITSGVLLAVALLASYLPARRASRIDPMESLRAE